MLDIENALDPAGQPARTASPEDDAPPLRTHGDTAAPVAPCRPQQLLELLCKAVPAPVGGVGLLAADAKLRDHWLVGIPDEVAAELRRSGHDAALVHFILRQRLPVRIPDFGVVRAELGLPDLLTKIGPFLAMPLICHGRPLGALYLGRQAGEPAFTAADEAAVFPVREWLAQGDLFDEARLLGQIRMLTSVAQAAAGSRDLPSILQVALHELERHLPLYVAVIWLLGEEAKSDKDTVKDKATRVAHAPPTAASTSSSVLKLAAMNAAPRHRAVNLGLAPGYEVKLGLTPFAACVQEGQALYLDLARSDERRSPFIEMLAARGANSTFAVPLRSGPQTVGILQCICTRSAGFSNDQIQILYQVADMLGPAICNCQLFSRLRSAYEELRHTQTQLIKSEKMRALGELASGMAHDFNNSLCGSLGFLELVLANKNLEPGLRAHLQSARLCTLDAAQTVRRVQDFARWQRKEFSVQFVDLNDVVRQTMELARHKWENLSHARGTPITVELETTADAGICGIASELREVLTNLVFNGVDAMPQGGKLSVRTYGDEEHIYLSVSDTGIGMSEAVRRRLFEPFFTTKGERGTGLGLSVTFGIVQRYGGDIAVESTVGKGTTFVIKFPRVVGGNHEEAAKNGSAAAPVSQAPASAPAAPATVAKTKAKALHVLVIDDEETIRRFLALGLSHLGHSSRLAADGQEGLALFAAEPFDVVLTDLGLPGMSGEDVARTIANRSPQTPVILLTGWSHQLRDAGQQIDGVTRVLGKPVTLDTLSGALAGVCTN